MKLNKRTVDAVKRGVSLSLAMAMMCAVAPTQALAAQMPTMAEVAAENEEMSTVVNIESPEQRDALNAKLASAPVGTRFCMRIRYGEEQGLDIPANQLHNNKVQAILWAAGFAKGNQLFVFESLGGGLYRIINMESGKILDAGGSEVCAPVVQNRYHVGPSGIWKITYNENHTYSLMNMATQMYLNVRGGGDAGNATPIILYPNDGTEAMQFLLQEVSWDEQLCAMEEQCVRIRYAQTPENVLDVPAQFLDKRNAPLQIWDETYGNNNQHACIRNTDNGWILACHETGKYIEVCNSSNKACASIVQDDPSDSPYAHWELLSNLDGSVTFVNRGSGLNMNCCGGSIDPANGTRIIQYWDDNSHADDFIIEVMEGDDVLSAVFEREITERDIEWGAVGRSDIRNETGWTKDGYVPKTDQRLLVRVDYLSPNATLKMLKERAYKPSFWQNVKKVLNGEADEALAAQLLEALDIDVPVIGGALGILHAILEIRENEENNRFVNAVNTDVNGRDAGVIIYTYKVVDLDIDYEYVDGRNRLVHKLVTKTEVEYGSWDGSNFDQVSTIPDDRAVGQWHYSYK